MASGNVSVVAASVLAAYAHPMRALYRVVSKARTMCHARQLVRVQCRGRLEPYWFSASLCVHLGPRRNRYALSELRNNCGNLALTNLGFVHCGQDPLYLAASR